MRFLFKILLVNAPLIVSPVQAKTKMWKYSFQDYITLESCLSLSNRGSGFRVESSGNVSISECHAFSNSEHGFELVSASSVVIINRSLTSSNGGDGIRFEQQSGNSATLKINEVNITGHYYRAAAHFENISDLQLEMSRCSVEDNFNDALLFDGVTSNSEISILDSNFTQNRGSTVVLSLLRDSRVTLRGNIFSMNHLNDFSDREAVVQISTFGETAGSKIIVDGNTFEQNAMSNVIELRHLGGEVTPVVIAKNKFIGNLARSVIDLDMPSGEIKGNYFNNVQSSCEISRASPLHADSVDNYWGHGKEADFVPRICTLNRSLNYEVFNAEDPIPASTSSSILVQPKSLAEPEQPKPTSLIRTTTARPSSALKPFENTYNQVKATDQPYSVESEVVVHPGQIVIVDPGTQLGFAPGIGLTVQDKGKLYLNGTIKQPIRLFGDTTWRGLVVKPGGTLVLSHAVIEGASIGLWIDSEKVEIEEARIIDSVVHGVEITANAASEVDLGGTVIERPKGSGVGVDERQKSLTIKNVAIRDGWGSGIDFVSPASDIRIENASVTNGSSYSIHIVEFPAAPLKSVFMRNVSVTEQSRGHAGVLITGGWIEEIDIQHSHFARNLVPSLIVGVECQDQTSQSRLSNSSFVNNEDTVTHFDVGQCGSVNVRDNVFTENNNNGRHGVLMVNAAPREGSAALPIVIEENEFTKNSGEYSTMMAMHGTNAANGSFRSNRLRDNINSLASVIVTSPYYRVEGNEFSNPLSKHELDVRSDGSWKLQTANNSWATDDMAKAINAPEGSVGGGIIQARKESEFATSDNQMCAHLNFCSSVGKCAGGICMCPTNRIGLDCSIMIGCPANCSSNGVCDLMNKCTCFEGWTSADCSTPICRFDCHGHGKCVSRDECECNEGWAGQFCDEPGCRDGTCIHGTCVKSECQCEDGWQGSRCSIPICHNCSINGQCTAPNNCQCYDGYQGEDCSICHGPPCQACDYDCVHGTCERETRTCSCARGWSGAACDVCRSGNCQVKSSVLYILPSTVDREDVNAVVNVFGTEFPKTLSSSYSCIFGASYSKGVRISSSVVRCRVPRDLGIGRHLFNLAPEGALSVIPNFDVRPIHFTVYDSCSPAVCKGVCIGPLCVCPKGATGLSCEIIELIPTIDRQFIQNQKAGVAFEGTPYIVVLPTMVGSLHQVNSSIADLRFDATRGIIEWEEPVGSSRPYEITVVSSSLSGESSITWNVTVEPSYVAEVSSVEKLPGLNAMRITGRLKGLQSNYSAPLTLWVKHRNQDDPMQILIKSDGDSFTYDFVADEPGPYKVVASHPSVAPISDGMAFEVPPLQLSMDASARGAVVRDVEQCDADMLRPRNGTIALEKMEGMVTIIERASDWREETVSLLRCDGKRELWRNRENLPTAEVIAVPSAITLLKHSTESKVFEVVIHRMGIFLRPPIKLISSDNTQPVFIIASDPDIDQINTYTQYRKIKLALGQNADYKEWKNNSLELVAAGEVMVRIPIYFVDSDAKFNVKICVQDSYEPRAPTQETAILSVSNTALGVDIVKSNVPLNRDYVTFLLSEGYYQITAKAANHRTLSEVVHITAANKSFCLNMEAIDPRALLTTGEGRVVMTKVKATNTVRTPYVSLEPVSANRSHSRVLATVTGTTGGLVSFAPFSNRFLAMTPSARSVPTNSSFWISLEWGETLYTPDGCDAHVVPLSFLFLPDGSEDLQKVTIDFLAESSKSKPLQWRICDDSSRPLPVALSTRVTCDCSQGARTNCRRRYKSATACGSAWKRIPDDTVSLHVLSTFLLLLTDCQTVQVNMTELDEAMQCISSLESECPILHQRRKRTDQHSHEVVNEDGLVVARDRQKRAGELDHPLSSLGLQSIRMASLYSEFIEKLQAIFPPAMTNHLRREEVDRFLRSIADDSELGLGISTVEAETIQYPDLVKLWNATVTEWTSGQLDLPGEGIPYSDAKQLVVAADRLKSLTRQNGANDPFSLLHEYIGQILTTNDSRDELCIQAAVLVDPLVIYEDSSVAIDVYIENLRDSTLTNIDLTIEFERNDMFAPRIEFAVGPSWSAGINSMNGYGVLAPKSSFEVHWTRKVVTENRLTATAFYQAIILLGFHKDGLPSKQRLKSPLLEIRPRRSVRLLHFVNGDITNSPEEPFSAMTAVMNIGYSSLSDVRIAQTSFDVVTSTQSAPFDIVRMELDGERIGNSLSPEVGDIMSGSSKRITYHITTPGQTAKIVNMSMVVTIEGVLTTVEDQHVYVIKAAASEKGGFIVSSVSNPEPVFFFRPDIGSIINIVPLEYVASQVKTIDDPKKRTVIASFRNQMSPGFTGALWGKFDLPPLPAEYRLTRVVDERGTRQRISTPVTWTEKKGEVQTLNFIDSGAPFPVTDIVYEMEFSEPTERVGPQFDQTSYRVQIFPGSWPQPGYPFAVISSHTPDSSNITYSLFTPDNEKTFAVDPNTGELFLASSVQPGEEFCTVLVATDSNGHETSVPVAINTGGARRDCISFDTTGLSSSSYRGPHRGTVGSWTTPGPPTRPTTEEPIYTISPDSSPMTPTRATVSIGVPTGTPTPPTINTASTSSSATPTTQGTPAGSTSDDLFPSPPLIIIPGGSGTSGTTQPTVSTESSTAPSVTEQFTTSETLATVAGLPSESTSGMFPSPPVIVPTATVPTPTATEIPEPTHPEPISPDASLETLHPSWPTTLPGPTRPEMPPTQGPTSATGTPTGEVIATVTPDSSPETIPSVTRATDLTEIPLQTAVTEPTFGPEVTVTVNPDGGSVRPGIPTFLPPIVIPGGGGTPATFAPSPRPTRTSAPHYLTACGRAGEPIWDLICALSKASIRKDP
ncbi:hypothetical protein Q1695_002846 [Nippostrongylus brasiliensis]|nr:hypothetical protein Q1695_002846 [Nippostrongylus brasiliensis]